MPEKMKSLCTSGTRRGSARPGRQRAGTGAEQAAGAEPEQRLDELVTRTRRRRRTGGSHTSTRWRSWRTDPDGRAQGPGEERAAEEQQQTDDQPADPFGGDVQGDHEHAEVDAARCPGPSRRPAP